MIGNSLGPFVTTPIASFIDLFCRLFGAGGTHQPFAHDLAPDTPRVFFIVLTIDFFDAGTILTNAVGFWPFRVPYVSRFENDALGRYVTGNGLST